MSDWCASDKKRQNRQDRIRYSDRPEQRKVGVSSELSDSAKASFRHQRFGSNPGRFLISMSLPKKGPGTASGNDASIALDAKEAFLEVIKACLYTRELSAGLVSETAEIGANRSDPN